MKVAVLIFISLVQNTKSLTTITAEQEKCTINKMGYRNCLFENVLVMNFNPNEQEIDILLQDYQGNSVGSMKFLMNRIKAKCVKAEKYYSRSYDIQIISGWRCPYTGSCTEMKCSSLKMNETIEELETDKNNYPKITRCWKPKADGQTDVFM
uniref:Phlebovirus glycoprotein G2 fusion domain-containing protein n=1 Tax=Meloidogyne incognita TaxID=6306 RepID=A0A914N156_MELIC